MCKLTLLISGGTTPPFTIQRTQLCSRFFSQVSFWILIFFLEGSFMFAFTSLLAYFDAHYPWYQVSCCSSAFSSNQKILL